MNITAGEMMAVKQVDRPQTISDMQDQRQVSVVEALKSESETLKNLDHPHIVQYLGFEETSEYFSMYVLFNLILPEPMTDRRYRRYQFPRVRSWWLCCRMSPETWEIRGEHCQVLYLTDLGWFGVSPQIWDLA